MRQRGEGPGRLAGSKRNAVLLVSGLVLVMLVVAAQVAARRIGLDPGAATLGVLAGAAALIVYGAAVAGAIGLVRRARREKGMRTLSMADVDGMEGREFEDYVGRLLKSQGYQVSHVGAPGDLGVDLIAVNGARRYAVQVKRQRSPVSRRAVSDAVAGQAQYRCNAAMVVTSAHFTNGALELARSNRCTLVDREGLAMWVAQYQKSK